MPSPDSTRSASAIVFSLSHLSASVANLVIVLKRMAISALAFLSDFDNFNCHSRSAKTAIGGENR